MISATKEFFISLTEHPGWGDSMTVWGEVSEADLAGVVADIIALPYSESKHPTYGTVMRLMTERMSFGLRAVLSAQN